MDIVQGAEHPDKRLQCCIMRKIVLGLGISLDGYIARPDGAVDFLFMPKDYSMGPFFATIDTAIMGRKTLDAVLKMGGGSSPSGGGMATYVFSHTKPPGERDGFTFVNESPAAFVARLRKRKGEGKGKRKDKDIWLMGGGELAREFLKADLVDELYIGVVPVLLGEGIPLFPSGFPQRNFALVENKTFSKGMIALKYKRVRSKAKRKS
jgi:dihydrofolate reductase